MVVRYPHSATVHVITTTITNGEYTSESDSTQQIKGRLEYSAARRIEKEAGQYTDITAAFFTIVKSITGAQKLTVGAVTFVIIRWVDYQNYSEIWLE